MSDRTEAATAVEPAVFHPLTVAEVVPVADDAVAITFDVPDDLRATFRYLPGQHVTVRATIDGDDIRRTYSICADATTGVLRIGVRRLVGGRFSTWATTRLRPGMVLGVTPPSGEFVIDPDPDRSTFYGAIAAGSGITPVLSLIATTLRVERGSRWSLLFGNRDVRSIMFLDELEGLKDRYPDRLQLVHVLSREATEVPLFHGRLDAERLPRLLDRVVPADRIERWFLCGPYDMVTTARTMLEGRGVAPDAIADELFFPGPPPTAPPTTAEDTDAPVLVRLRLAGRETATRMRPEEPILDAALRVRPELPFSCRGGMCASCKAYLVEGEVRLDRNYALTGEELAAGFILTCQAHPTTDEVVVDYDRR